MGEGVAQQRSMAAQQQKQRTKSRLHDGEEAFSIHLFEALAQADVAPPPHPRSHLSLVTTPIASGASGQDHGNEF